MSDDVDAVERRGWEALSGPDGAAFYAEAMADDGVMVFPGAVLDKHATLRAIAGATPWASYELHDVHVMHATPDVRIVTYEALAERPGETAYRALMSSVYARRDGRWALILHQQTPSPARQVVANETADVAAQLKRLR